MFVFTSLLFLTAITIYQAERHMMWVVKMQVLWGRGEEWYPEPMFTLQRCQDSRIYHRLHKATIHDTSKADMCTDQTLAHSRPSPLSSVTTRKPLTRKFTLFQEKGLSLNSCSFGKFNACLSRKESYLTQCTSPVQPFTCLTVTVIYVICHRVLIDATNKTMLDMASRQNSFIGFIYSYFKRSSAMKERLLGVPTTPNILSITSLKPRVII